MAQRILRSATFLLSLVVEVYIVFVPLLRTYSSIIVVAIIARLDRNDRLWLNDTKMTFRVPKGIQSSTPPRHEVSIRLRVGYYGRICTLDGRWCMLVATGRSTVATKIEASGHGNAPTNVWEQGAANAKALVPCWDQNSSVSTHTCWRM